MSEIPLDQNCIHVIDGGFLLHKVVWPPIKNFDNILKSYVEFMKNHYSLNSHVVFDGYPEQCDKSTKAAERHNRQARKLCPDIEFDLNMTCPVSQDKFFFNESNKKRFIGHLKTKLEELGFSTYQAYEDADTLIVETAIKISSDIKPTIIVAEDIDVLVIFISKVKENKNIYFWKASKGKNPEKVFNCDSFLASLTLDTSIRTL